jgi:CubicO group peptidase (beta-lactamase class C family)
MLVDVTGRSFPDLMRELVLYPLGMHRSTFEQPLSPEREAATAHDAHGTRVDGGWHVYPELAAAGLWTTPSDLARFALDVQRALAGAAPALLSQSIAREMLTPQIEAEPGIAFGLGFQLEGDHTGRRFGHSGGNMGFISNLVAFREGGKGSVVMTNGNNGMGVIREIEAALAREYAWPDFPTHPWTRSKWEQAAQTCAGRYELRSGCVLEVQPTAGGLLVRITGQEPMRFVPASELRYVAEFVDTELRFERDEDSACAKVIVRQNDADLPAVRIG